MVSVPLRGCCFKIGNVTDYYIDGVKLFPSPCGDVVLKLRGMFPKTH